MNCPKCGYDRNQAAITNSHPPDQVVRKRMCNACCHVWFTVELEVSRDAIGWSALHQNKPVLRAPVTLTASYVDLGSVGLRPRQCEELSQPA
jgi:hypothetical protein